MLFRSLRLRILVTFALVLIAAIGTIALAAQRITVVRFQQYAFAVSRQDQLALTKLLTMYHQTSDLAAFQNLVDQMAVSTDQRILFVGGDQRVIADSAHQFVGQPVKCLTANGPGSDCFANGASIPPPRIVVFANTGAVRPVPQPPGKVTAPAPSGGQGDMIFVAPGVDPIRIALRPPLNDNPADFIRSIDYAILWATMLGGALALLLTFVLSARILRPVKALTRAARQMERGDLGQRVPVRGKDELGVLAHAFNAMADSVARAERLRRTMLGDVAHDLRTPLTNIRGYLEAIEDGVVPATPHVLRSLQDEVLLLNRLVDDLQELAQAEAGQLRFDCRPLDLGETLRQAAVVVAPRARAKGVQLDLQAPVALPRVLADAERVGQVLRNLLQNGITYTPADGRVTISAVATETEVEVRVADTGVGIPPEHLLNIFERFYRVDPARNRATGGSGLGLAIVKQLVERQGGRVTVESVVGEGSTFRFTLPLAPNAAAARDLVLA